MINNKDTIHALASSAIGPAPHGGGYNTHQQHQCQQDHACMHCEYAKLSAKTKPMALCTIARLSFQKSHETNLATIVLPHDKPRHFCNFNSPLTEVLII